MSPVQVARNVLSNHGASQGLSSRQMPQKEFDKWWGRAKRMVSCPSLYHRSVAEVAFKSSVALTNGHYYTGGGTCWYHWKRNGSPLGAPRRMRKMTKTQKVAEVARFFTYLYDGLKRRSSSSFDSWWERWILRNNITQSTVLLEKIARNAWSHGLSVQNLRCRNRGMWAAMRKGLNLNV